MSIKIDFHTHILPETWPNLKEVFNLKNFKNKINSNQKFGYFGWVQMSHTDDGTFMMRDDGTIFRPVKPNVWSITERLSDMEKTGVSVQVLSTVPVMFSYWAKPSDAAFLCRFLNDHMASEVKRNPSKFIGFGTLPMQSPELAVEEMKRCKIDLKLNGIMIGSHVNEFNLSDNRFDMIWKTSQELDLPIFVHPWGMEQTGRMSKYWLPWLVGMPAETCTAILSMIYSGVFEKFGQLKVGFAHGAGMLPYVFGRAEHCFQVYPKDMQQDNPFPPSKYLGRIYADALVHSTDSLNLAIKTLGEDSLFLGSDYPFLLGEHHPGLMIETSEINKTVKDKILYKNLCKFLDIDERNFK